MVRVGQIGIALGALGIVLAVMGLFPAVTGLPPTPGIGAVQLVTIMIGFSLLIFGAYIYARFTFYPRTPANLAQQIGVRLSLTGLLLAGMAAMADVLGFGSNLRTETDDLFFGPWQAAGLIGGFVIAALGILIYAVSGSIKNGEELQQPAIGDTQEAETEAPTIPEAQQV